LRMRKAEPVHTSRLAALRLLRGVLDSGRNLERQVRREWFLSLSSPEQRLARRITDGVLRYLRRFDYYVEKLASRPLEKIDRDVLWILRIGLYQIEFLNVPGYAAVNETTELCRILRKKSATGFVNGILRSFLRGPPPLPGGDSPSALAVRESHPEWLIERYLERYGLERTIALLKSNNRHPESVLWINPFKTCRETFMRALAEEGIPFSIPDDLPGGLRIEARSFHLHPLYRKGHCFFMDPASQIIACLPQLEGVERVVDLCAAPGGKTFVLASRLQKGTLFGCDISFSRLAEMAGRARFLEIPGLSLVQADLRRRAPFSAVFDLVLADVPCSGLGTLSANPEIRWLVQPEDLSRHRGRQLSILENGFQCLREGGRIVYSTCSTEPEENEEVVERFLDRRPDVELEDRLLQPVPGSHLFYAVCLRRKISGKGT